MILNLNLDKQKPNMNQLYIDRNLRMVESKKGFWYGKNRLSNEV